MSGRNDTHWECLRIQVDAGAALVSSVLLGSVVALSPDRAWIIVAAVWVMLSAVVWVTLSAAVSDLLRWNPPDPLFLIFGLCAVASVPSTGASVLFALSCPRPAPRSACSLRWPATGG